MSHDRSPLEFDKFTAWLASKLHGERYNTLLAAARQARDDTLLAARQSDRDSAAAHAQAGHLEVLQLLAAADNCEMARPPELMTARGFRVTLAYDQPADTSQSSICVLVRCPPELIANVQGQTAYLWSGSERFELGQFDSDGKAIGTLPAGIEISLSDFTLGKVKLEEPSSAPKDG